jgi:predicted Fe-Mo cluster-binding NifX family protein
MKLCFPVATDAGVESEIYGHFASAPFFAIVDTQTRQSELIANCDRNNPFGGCSPFSALNGSDLAGIIVGGIGDESLRVMNMCGFKVYQAGSPAIADNLALFEADSLPEVTIQHSHLEGRCSSGEGGHSCSHQH